MNKLTITTDSNGTDLEINFYNYHAVDVLEIVLKDTGITEFMPEKIALLEEKLKDLCKWCCHHLKPPVLHINAAA